MTKINVSFKFFFLYRLYELMNQLSCIIAAAMNQNEGWYKTGNIALMHIALKFKKIVQNCLLRKLNSTVFEFFSFLSRVSLKKPAE